MGPMSGHSGWLPEKYSAQRAQYKTPYETEWVSFSLLTRDGFLNTTAHIHMERMGDPWIGHIESLK